MTASDPPFRLALRPLDATGFAPFGAVVAAGSGPGILVNEGRARRFDAFAGLDHAPAAARLALATYRIDGSALPMGITLLERHPHSDQLFAPMTASAYLVVVAPTGPGGGPSLAGMVAFAARGDQAVIYRAGVWHHPLAALERPADFLMAMWETGSEADTEISRLDRPHLVDR